MLVHLVDPPAYTPPYDHALAAALARAGVRVELVTSRFRHGPVPAAEGYRVVEHFYRAGGGSRLMKLAQHAPDMLRYRRRAAAADLVHWQWLPVQPLDVRLLAPKRPRVLTAHDVLPREPRPGQVAATRRLLRKMDAVLVHSEHGARRLRDEIGVERVHVVPHGAFEHLTRVPGERPLPAELAAVDGPVVLFFGLLRPYKGLGDLVEAFRSVEGAELWIVGAPRMPLDGLRARAGSNVRLVPRFVPDEELAAYFRRADLVVLPYREIDQSGVLFTALAFGKPLVLTDVGGFGEVAAHGAARLVPPGDVTALADAMGDLLADDAERSRLAVAASRAAADHYSWDEAARRTLAVYRELLR